ncbi:MAG: hypothetical protein A2161_21095 [Candidatus Schekmanbacteria bacterium RBG_13_48_7]|uniref:Rubrerythrin diiron-binding domain-containing protein n=1 Tax=Candidatus Schekmanbacteria bacterium RBG_13_48_7 TaxID=1817878 RepID=A0A1F7RN58_9BACT|nr:MAG: hypothetical protein A2161_21095 [Candidatus Schekmanbacteria bacterium RBG_13_48_7]
MPEKLKDVINFAVKKEQEAADFYYDLAGKIKSPAMEKELRKIAAMEEGHRDKLKKIDFKSASKQTPKEVMDLKISDYLVEKEPTPDMSWQELLTVAMKREQASLNLYKTMSKMFKAEKAVSQVFDILASEEAAHKLYFEKIYDDDILKEN